MRATRTLAFAALLCAACSEGAPDRVASSPQALPPPDADTPDPEAPLTTADLANTYTLEVELDPASQALEVEGTMEIVADGPTREADFLLNGGLEVATFEPDVPAEVTFEHGVALQSFEMPNTQRITVRFAQPLAEGDRVTIDIAYRGFIRDDTIEFGGGLVSEDWVEMSLGPGWYPYWGGEPWLRADLSLALPERYEVIGPGSVVDEGGGRWHLDPGIPVLGRLTFAAAPEWVVESRELGAGALPASVTASLYTAVPEPKAEAFLDAVDGAYTQFFGVMGAPRSGKTELTIVHANGEVEMVNPSASFATGEDYVLLGQSDLQGQQELLSHEIAHVWWLSGSVGTPDEFMIESLAEYLSFRYGHARWGEDWLAGKLERAERVSATVDTSILDITGYSEGRQALLYFRGPLVLWELQERIGEADMDALLREAYRLDVSELGVFIDLLREQEGNDTADWFRTRL